MSINKNIWFMVDGINLNGAIKSFAVSQERTVLEATTVGTTGAKAYEPGIKDGTMEAEGIWDGATTAIGPMEDQLAAAFTAGTDLEIAATETTPALGDRAWVLENANVENYGVNVEIDQLIMVNLTLKCENGAEPGKIVGYLNDSTVGTNGASLDNTAATTNGGYFQAHLYELSDSAATDADIRWQHSTNDSTWADLSGALSFGAAAGSVSYTAAPGTTINRYTRCTLQTTTGKGYALAIEKRR